jgi:hypothetical protein
VDDGTPCVRTHLRRGCRFCADLGFQGSHPFLATAGSVAGKNEKLDARLRDPARLKRLERENAARTDEARRTHEIHVRERPDVVAKIQERADAEGRSFAAEVRRALRRSLAGAMSEEGDP